MASRIQHPASSIEDLTSCISSPKLDLYLILLHLNSQALSRSTSSPLRAPTTPYHMPVLKYDSTVAEEVRPGLERKIIVTGQLMTVLIDFSDGPWEEAEPPHSHPHVQTSYVAEGEIIFYCEGEEDQHLKAGDMFAVQPGKLHTVKLLTKNVRLVDSFNPLREDFLK